MAHTRSSLARIASRRLLPAVILGACAACAHVPQQSESTKRAGIEASNLEMSMRTVALGREFLREVEIAGDSIEARTPDISIHRNSLQWKLSCVPAVEEAVLCEDHVIAMLDLTAFRLQMAAFLDSPAGAEAFGAELPFAQHALARLGPKWEAAAASIDYHLSEQNLERLRAWAREHPIERVPFMRSTILGGMAGIVRDQGSSIGAAVGGIQESIDRLELRISLANEFAIKQATWLSQLAALEVRSSPEATELTGTLHSTRALVEDAPDLVRRERIAALEDVDRQRQETIAALAEERVMLFAEVAKERAILLDAVDEQRRLAMRDVDSLRVRLIADEVRVVDHLMLRVAELLGALVVVAGAGLLLMRRRAAAA
jgi:hypothetical protein